MTLLASFLVLSSANAALIKFNATGVAGVSGYVEFDDSAFNGGDQFLSNTNITDLNLNVFGDVFGIADVAVSSLTFMNSSGLFPVIINGGGNIADNGIMAIAFFPDGFGGTASDGDASLSLGLTGSLASDTFYAVKWEVVTSEVSEPSAIILLCGGLLLIFARKFKKA